jgi:hypothetical protein
LSIILGDSFASFYNDIRNRNLVNTAKEDKRKENPRAEYTIVKGQPEKDILEVLGTSP